MSDTTPSGPPGGDGTSDEPPQADAPLPEADKKADLAELFGIAPKQPGGDDQVREVVPPWETSAEPAKKVDDGEDLLAQRVRQAAKELAEAPPADEADADDSPVLDTSADFGLVTEEAQPPEPPASTDESAAGPPDKARAEKRPRRRPAEAERVAGEQAPQVSDEVAADHRMSGARHETGAAAEQRRPSVVTVEPGEPLALPQADPQYLQKVQEDLASDGPSVIVRYGAMRQTGLFTHHLDVPPTTGTKVVIRSERGVELGRVISRICTDGCSGYGYTDGQQVARYVATNGPKYPFKRDGKVLRVANTQDLGDDRTLAGKVREQTTFCRQQIAELKLDMRLITVEDLLGGERMVFYFTSDERVDFRELVRRLTGKYHTRVELRQVGARDEARLVGDFERCGRQCCCRTFIKDLQPVSMRMAKLQKATLDPLKISGRCSRLMCCLRYEDESYKELRKRLPRKNTWVRTASLVGKVVDAQVLTQLLRIQMPDRSQTVIAVEEVVARDVEPPEMAEQFEQGPAGPQGRRGWRTPVGAPNGRLRDGSPDTPKGAALPMGDGETLPAAGARVDTDAQARPAKRRKADRGPRAQQGQPGGQSLQPATASDAQGPGLQSDDAQRPATGQDGADEAGDQAKRKRRRRRKKKK